MRGFTIPGVLLLGAALVVGCQAPAEPVADVSALNLAVGPPGPSITGSTALTVGNPGQKRTLNFNARMTPGGFVGRFSGNNRFSGNVFSGRLTCLTILKGGEARFAGVVERSNFRLQVGKQFGWRAVDGDPDQVSYPGFLTKDAAAFCSTTTDNPNLFDSESGSIRIREGGILASGVERPGSD